MDYDELGRLTTYTDALGQQVTYHYDSEGKPSKRTEDSKNDVNKDSIVKRFNAKGNSIAYSYVTPAVKSVYINLGDFSYAA